MTSAAGTLHLAPDGKILFLRRGSEGDHAGEWCFPGGTTEAGETAEDTAKRETAEEIGSLPKGTRELLARRVDPVTGTDFTTFLQHVDETFEPTLNGEHDGSVWATAADAPQPLHPGVAAALARLSGDELDIARLIAAKELTSPQRYKNVHLFDIRITGTGIAHRNAVRDAETKKVIRKAEWVYRRPSDYLTPDFLTRCAGLPVIMEHPDSSVLNSDEFADRTVGTMLLPRIEGDEVWGIAKIYDDNAASIMSETQLSTSPGVVLRGAGEDKRVLMDDGSILLIEGKPSLLDHLAICEQGVWDKGGDPVGVRSQTVGDSTVTEDEIRAAEEAKAKKDAEEAQAKKDAEEKEERERKDAETSGKLDKMLSHLDSMSRRMDAIEAKEKGEPGEDVTDSEAEMMDSEASEAESEAKEMEESEEATAADKSRSRKRADSMRKRADSAKGICDKRRADAARADADARVDSVRKELKAEFDAKLAEIAGTVKEPTEGERAALANAQARVDAVALSFGTSAPRPLQGETESGYRKRLLKPFKKHSAAWKDIDLDAVTDSVLAVAESQILNDAAAAALNPTDLPYDQLREVITIDEDTGRRTKTFYGQPGAWMDQFKSGRARVTNIDTRKDH